MSAIREELDEFIGRLQTAAGTGVESVVLYGSAARSDFHERYSDVNLLVVLKSAAGKILDQIRPVIAWWTNEKGERPPQLLTEEELRSSADVFAIETLDVKENHRLLAGRDILATVDVPMNLHRVQVERELRSLLLRLRQHYVVGHGHEREMQDALAKSSSSVFTLLRHALIALGRPAPNSRREIAAQIATLDGIDDTALHAVLDLREGRRVEFGIDTLYVRYMDTIAAVVRYIDRCAPKQQWRRVGEASHSPERID